MRATSPRLVGVSAGFVVLLLSAAAPGAAAPRLPARFVPGDGAVSAAVQDQSAPFLAAGGDRVLAVWSDNRANPGTGYDGETSKDIYGFVLDAAGQPLSSVPLALVAEPASQENPRAAWNGSAWLLVFESYVRTFSGYYQKSLAAVRVDTDGAVLDSRSIPIFNVTPTGATWAVAGDSAGWVIAVQGTGASGDLVALRVSNDGVLDPQPRSLVAATYYLRGNLRLAQAGGVFLLAYEESMTGSSASNGVRFDSTLTRLDTAPFPIAPSPLATLISNGAGFYAVWSEQRPDYTIAVKGARIGTNGQVFDNGGDDISGANAPQAYTTTSATWDGGNWKVTWGNSGGTRVARVSTLGKVLDAGGVLVPGVQPGLAASTGDGSVQMVRSEYSGTGTEVLAQRIDAGNAAGPLRTLSIGAPAQFPVDVVADPAGYLLVYRSATAGAARILAQRLDTAGDPTTAGPVELDAATSGSLPGTPAVAWNGSVFLAAWGSASGIVARRLAANGAPLDAAPFLVASPAFGPVDVAALGGDFLVVGLRCGYTCQYIAPIASRVAGSDGSVLDAPPIGISSVFASTPRVAALGGRWLVVWRNNASHDDPYAFTNGVFIDAAGIKLPEFAVHGPYSSVGGNGIFGLGLASSGATALVVQSQELTSGVETDLLARRVAADGTVSAAVNLTPWAGDQYRPQATWDGSRFVVVWQDQRLAFDGDWGLDQLDARGDVVGMRITEAGAVVDPQGFVVSDSPFGETHPSLDGRGGVTLVAAAYLRNDGVHDSYRIGYGLYGAGGNQWPVARAAATPTAGAVPVSVQFDSTGSADPDGSVASTSWSFGDGFGSASPSPAHTYLDPGPFVATLDVTDSAGATSRQGLLIDVAAPNQPPVAVASSNVSSGPAPLAVVFSAAGSYDPDGWLGNIRWDFSDGGTYWGATAYHTFSQEGTWTATLTVYDSGDATGSTSLTVTAGAPLPPAAPSNLQAIAFTTEWINVTWTDNSNSETGFTLERCPGTAAQCAANPSLFAPIATTSANIDYYADRGLPLDTTFTYRVRAFNGSGTSAYSATATATTLGSVPAAPTSLTAAAGTSGKGRRKSVWVDLSWRDNSGNEASFVVERCAGAGCASFAVVATLPANATSWRDSAVGSRIDYSYRVQARNATGGSAYSNVVSLKTP